MKQIFKLNAPYKPAGDQKQAIDSLTKSATNGMREQVLVGVTGCGKTYTMAQTIARLNRPTLIISHNKTLAAQLYQEFRDFFPLNAVSYFVSYYDYYQPEAYIPQSNTYIDKETEINEDIDKLRLAATMNILTRPDTIVVASVSSIYNIGSPREYGNFVLELMIGMPALRETITERLVQLQYERNDYGFHRSTFRIHGDAIDIFPAYEDFAYRIVLGSKSIVSLEKLDPLTGKTTVKPHNVLIFPAKHYMTDPAKHTETFEKIMKDCEDQVKKFNEAGKYIEAQRISERVTFDLEMIGEVGYVNGIENYSRYFDGRNPGDPPYTLFNYFDDAVSARHLAHDWLCFIDESHMTIPQIRGMYNGDRSRKQTLIDYGFRLPAALDNRPLRFDEFLRRIPTTIYVSATPDEWEIQRVNTQPQKGGIAEQLIRPTGLVDPTIDIRPTTNQIDDLCTEIDKRVVKHERVLVTTLTKRMAEDLATYLEEKGINVHYLHSDVETLERTDILADLRRGRYDVVVGINLLREGLDLPEVSLVAILDADKEGFLRSRTSLIQIMGRAARHINGQVILYADHETKSMKAAIEEVTRRRNIQMAFNASHNITPTGISKPIRDQLIDREGTQESLYNKIDQIDVTNIDKEALTPKDKKHLITKLTSGMRMASRDLDFERAAAIRDLIQTLRS